MGYTASKNVDPLDYDFKPFADIKGTTPEFEHERIKQYWAGYQSMQRRHVDDLKGWADKREALGENASNEALDVLENEYEAWQQESVDRRLVVRRQLLAMLCSDCPSVEELEKIPIRVFDDFEFAMQNELTPKAMRPASS